MTYLLTYSEEEERTASLGAHFFRFFDDFFEDFFLLAAWWSTQGRKHEPSRGKKHERKERNA